jgi:hypothetical protein
MWEYSKIIICLCLDTELSVDMGHIKVPHPQKLKNLEYNSFVLLVLK